MSVAMFQRNCGSARANTAIVLVAALVLVAFCATIASGAENSEHVSTIGRTILGVAGSSLSFVGNQPTSGKQQVRDTGVAIPESALAAHTPQLTSQSKTGAAGSHTFPQQPGAVSPRAPPRIISEVS